MTLFNRDACSKIVCVGRNYRAHAVELGNDVPSEPIIFIKPPSALTAIEGTTYIPKDQGSVHVETELAILITKPLTRGATLEEIREAIGGLGLAFDLTLRDLQSQLKLKGHPWERAKAFDGSCAVSEFLPLSEVELSNELSYELRLNDRVQQIGVVENMIWSPVALIEFIVQSFSLDVGDLVLTGTPEGVTEVQAGDRYEVCLANGKGIAGSFC